MFSNKPPSKIDRPVSYDNIIKKLNPSFTHEQIQMILNLIMFALNNKFFSLHPFLSHLEILVRFVMTTHHASENTLT